MKLSYFINSTPPVHSEGISSVEFNSEFLTYFQLFYFSFTFFYSGRQILPRVIIWETWNQRCRYFSLVIISDSISQYLLFTPSFQSYSGPYCYWCGWHKDPSPLLSVLSGVPLYTIRTSSSTRFSFHRLVPLVPQRTTLLPSSLVSRGGAFSRPRKTFDGSFCFTGGSSVVEGKEGGLEIDENDNQYTDPTTHLWNIS